jgi:recombination protein RecT
MIPEFAKALPPEVSPERFVRIVMTTLQSNPRIMDCDLGSVYQSITSIAQLGLLPDPMLGEAYVVPYGRKAQAIIGYKGLCKLARQSNMISKIEAHAIHELDHFDHELGSDPRLVHRPPPLGEERGEIIGFYACAFNKDGSTQFAVMTTEEVNAIRDKSQGYQAFKSGRIKSTPWDSHWEEMGRKSPIRKLAKDLPLAVQQAVAMDVAYDLGKASVLTREGAVETSDVLIDISPVEDESAMSSIEKQAAKGASKELLKPAAVKRLLAKQKQMGLTDEGLEMMLKARYGGVATLADVEGIEPEVLEDMEHFAKAQQGTETA